MDTRLRARDPSSLGPEAVTGLFQDPRGAEKLFTLQPGSYPQGTYTIGCESHGPPSAYLTSFGSFSRGIAPFGDHCISTVIEKVSYSMTGLTGGHREHGLGLGGDSGFLCCYTMTRGLLVVGPRNRRPLSDGYLSKHTI